MKRFRHLLLKTGKYWKGGKEFVFTAERLKTLVRNFQLMRKNGVDVKVVVDHRLDAEGSRGVVNNIVFDEKSGELSVVHELPDEDANLPERCSTVSAMVVPSFTDGHGNKYGECVLHSSYVQSPVVPAQPAAIAAGLWFDLGDVDMPEAIENTETSPEVVLGELLVLLELSEGSGWSEVVGAVKKLVGKEDKAKEEAPEAPEAPLEASLQQIDFALSLGLITPAVAKSLKASTKLGLTEVLSLMASNRVVTTGEKTGGQAPKPTLSLADRMAESNKTL